MKAKLLQGKPVAEAIKDEVAAEIAELVERHGIRPGLAVVRVGDDPASAVYVASKVRSSEEVGIVSRHHHLPAETSHDEVLALVKALNADDEIDGILVQLPLPKQIDETVILDAIDPAKD